MKEFRAFLLRGNVVDLAIAVVIGSAFGAIVSSLVKDVIMPPIGKVTGGIDFASLYVALGGTDAVTKRPIGIYYGNFINAVIIFVIVAAVVFYFVVKPMARIMPAKVEDARECPECLTAIPIAARRCSACGQPVSAEA
jgi:large conductance mechanosensitive channel